MNYYNNITFWENYRRLEKLSEFRKRFVDYQNGLNTQFNESRDSEREELARLRSEINLMIPEISDIVQASRVPAIISWTPPAFVGGRTQDVSIFDNLFMLDRFGIKPQYVLDIVERAIGVYVVDKKGSVSRTFNPLWWVGKAIEAFARIPFGLIAAAGFDAERAESSILGRLVKAAMVLIPVVAALLTILDKIGRLDMVRALIGVGN